MSIKLLLKKILLALVLFSLATLSIATTNAKQLLDQFLQNKTIAANFTQTVYSKKKNKVSQGTMKISRPNKFLWQYDGDEGQVIISDSKNIYLYDKLLQQVTIKKLSTSLGKSPALLLAGGHDIKKYYKMENQPDDVELEWVKLIPITDAIKDNNGFKLVKIGFNKKTQQLAQMDFIDALDNKSSISFSAVKIGLKFDEKIFSFKAPKGIDVIKDDN